MNSGGKGSAATVDTNAEFEVLMALLTKKTGPPITLNVSFDLEGWDAFRIRKRVRMLSSIYAAIANHIIS